MKNTNLIIWILIFIFLFFKDTVSIANQNKVHTPLKIMDLMTVAEFNKTGLNKLSESELRELDKWINAYTIRIFKSVPNPSPKEIIESKIDGEFEGWEGETIFKLENGQIWQQVTYSYTYHYAYRPEVVIYKTSGGYKMKVEGISEEIYVQQIK